MTDVAAGQIILASHNQDHETRIDAAEADIVALEGRVPLFARKTSTETVNNSSVLQNDNDLLLSVAANTVYKMNMRLRVSSGTTPDFKCLFTFPTGLTMFYNCTTVASGGTALQNFDNDQTTTIALEGGQTSVMFDGIVVVAGTAGTLQLTWAQATANASNTSVLAGSYLMLQKVA